MEISRFRKFLAVPFAILLLAGCSSTEKALRQYERHLLAGQNSQAAALAAKRAEKKDSSQPLWSLLAGNGLLLQEKFSGSILCFDQAEDIFQANDTRSIFSKGMTSTKILLTNDRAIPYNNLGQDRLFCCLYKAIAYLAQKNTNAARTELNRACDHQENWLFERRKDIAAESEQLRQQSSQLAKEKGIANPPSSTENLQGILGDRKFAAIIQKGCGYDPATSGLLEKMPESAYTNAYLSHFCGIFRWLNGDDGRNFLRDALRLHPDNPVLQGDFQQRERGETPQNQVWIYIEDGLCPGRKEWRLDLPLWLIPGINRYVLYTGMALPVLVPRPPACQHYVLQFGDSSLPVTELENISRLLRTEYDIYMRGALQREITRALLRAAAQAALGISAHSCNDSTARAVLQAAWVATGVTARAATAADVRNWISLPQTVFLQRISRPADGKITISARTGAMAENLPVLLPEGNSILWIRKIAPATPMHCQILTF